MGRRDLRHLAIQQFVQLTQLPLFQPALGALCQVAVQLHLLVGAQFAVARQNQPLFVNFMIHDLPPGRESR